MSFERWHHSCFDACNDGTSTSETKDTTTATNVSSSNMASKMDEGMMTPINAMMGKK